MGTAQPLPLSRKKIYVRGIVQGVGFRPFVYNVATGLGLAGYVLNSSAGVTIEIEGAGTAVEQFLQTLRNSPPPLAQIEDITISDARLQGDSAFLIHESQAHENEFVLVSPDVATCNDCWREFGDSADRRYGYPFTNCTNCGPRYTIIQDVPYDRPRTTMSRFKMCALCRAEYEDPADRRFHAQPNACPVCGPALTLVQRGSIPETSKYLSGSREVSASIICEVRKLLRDGNIVAVKGLGGFLLACDAQNDASVSMLRSRKRRSDKPFALMARDIAAVESFCIVCEEDRVALLSSRRPIVILPRRPGASLSSAIAPGNDTLGVMLPYTPLHYLLFSDSPDAELQFSALVMTSGNISDEPIVISNDEAWQRLQTVADWFLSHNREIYMRADDSVVRTFEGRERVLRRARGYVPQPIDLGTPFQELLACGGQLKNTFCLTKDRFAILSQHIGDLENYETLQFFNETLTNLKKLFRVTPQAIAHDLHPHYMSTRIALESDIAHKIGVQHHHAHIASCMAENHLSEKVIGVALDGTGYGTDGKIWGCEFLIADLSGFERRAHLRYVPLAGGDAAVREPWRMALSYLRDTFGNGPLPDYLSFFAGVPESRIRLVEAMIARNIQTVETSSCGRLFDAVASLIGICHEVTFEGQAAIALEAAAQSGVDDHYRFHIENGTPAQLDLRPMIEDMMKDLSSSKSLAHISASFHNTLAVAIVEICRQLRQSDGVQRVCLSGGTFQNAYLLEHTVRALHRFGFGVSLHTMVPPNDGGLSLGQAVIANQLLREGA